MSEKLCLKWNNFQENLNSAFGSLREDNAFTDVTLACVDGKQQEAHKVILASTSPFFQNLLRKNKHGHPIVYLKGMKSEELVAMLDFLYYGEANVFQENLDSFLAIADELQLKGLTNGETATEEMPITKKEIPVFKKEPNISARLAQTSSRNQAVSDGTVAGLNHSSEVLQGLNNDVETLMERTLKKNEKGKTIFRCTVCGKEAAYSNDIKKHIEANHLEGVSIPCNLCEKIFRSRNALAQHKHYTHKD